VPSRTASPEDVAVDAAGVVVGAVLALSGRIALLGPPAQN
jgi:VanZ family protein